MKSNRITKTPRKLEPNKDKVIISSEYYENDRPSYICSICNRTLIRLTDAGLNNTAFWCRHCSVEFNPETENLRKESKLSVPDRNKEGSITSIGVTPDVSIRHEPEIKGAFKALQ
jgi:DNA-directed RNA polymerase subunit RPC12/RpoP